MGWLVGIDSYRPVEFKDLENYLNICVCNRTGYEKNLNSLEKVQKTKLADRTVFVQSDYLDISSTLIRKTLRSGNSNELSSFYKLIPQAVDYVSKNNIWNHELKFVNRDVIKKNVLFKSNISAEMITNMLRKVNYLNNEECVSKFDLKSFGEDRGCSGTLWLISNIEYKPENNNDENKKRVLVIKSSGRAGGYANGLEEYFYSKCAAIFENDSIFIKCFGLFEFENRSLYIMEYIKDSTCIERDIGLNLPLVLFSIKNLVSLEFMF